MCVDMDALTEIIGLLYQLLFLFIAIAGMVGAVLLTTKWGKKLMEEVINKKEE